MATIDLKTQKYDRQLRLWASTGQQALELANICLLNANSTGCEIIKNLVLPGVGHVTIVDNARVTKEDIRSNFFLDAESAGQSKAKSAAELLQELNEDAAVNYVEKDPNQLIESQPDFFNSFTMVLAVNLHATSLQKLASICHSANKILITVKCKGLLGTFTIQSPEHTVIETHPENVADLRLSCPFQQLADYVDKFDLDGLDQTDHGHVPFVVVLLKYAKAYQDAHNGKAPQTYQERQELIKMLRENMRTPDEENFEEAIANVWRLASSSNVSSEVRQIFEDVSCQEIHGGSSYFWVLTRAVRDFMENEGGGQLPLSGKLPDMKSDTVNYIQLQNVYRAKALSDLNAVRQRVQQLAEGFDMTISDESIETFCKNAANIRVIKYKQMFKESKEVQLLKNDENFAYHFVFEASDLFQSEYHRLPAFDEDVESLKHQVQLLLQRRNVPVEQIDEVMTGDFMYKAILNYVHFGDLEAPNLAALLGGLVAQEAIKLITHQYIPINNTCVFNGITSTSSVFQL
ncbi:NEDD8-activating enzyme E1 regulatory subunit [Choanephora cucurbitarum]|uniref:NEDD8-activating enzyme E1 regulatory subunit n=1 Tax=Choanephora cucurbitarum TaxID=101091 RepID=A0A1C7N1M0_9FUNG|nr:NEDD8-activating enzyme E1 regulatory subunit [Choanephora cucurbitarum]